MSSPNVLLITVDQMRYPCFRYPDGSGMVADLKDILGFAPMSQDNSFAQFFPGFLRLRRNSTIFKQHIIASAACVPSRATIYTGQYGTRTQVVETDSVFKFGSDPYFPWLHHRGIPTMGHWFRAAGYTTHYFGKWDLSYADEPGPQEGNLNPWGFADWESSVPDAQGGKLDELGVYRDPGYADLVCNFLQRQAAAQKDGNDTSKPWLAVASFVNPHDIASAYPISWWVPEGLTVKRIKHGREVEIPVEGVQTATHTTPWIRSIPAPGAVSNPLKGYGTVDLNPLGFPDPNTMTAPSVFSNPPTLHEAMTTKPDCQFDYAYKLGLAIQSRRPPAEWKYWTIPFQLQDREDDWFEAFGNFYAYLHSLIDIQIQQILAQLDTCGLTNDTLVVFLSDHGEYAGAHGGMIEKWHAAYEEVLHVPFVISSPLTNSNADAPQYIEQLTSHIDVLPTLLNLAGFDAAAQSELAQQLIDEKRTVVPLPGANLAPLVSKPTTPVVHPTGEAREGVFFITYDTITNYLEFEEPMPPHYGVFLQQVNRVRERGIALATGSVTDPCCIQAVRTEDWKLARYFDLKGEATDQWELYYLVGDEMEQFNLLSWDREGRPILQPERIQEGWSIDAKQLEAALQYLSQLLADYQKRYLGGPPSIQEPYVLEETLDAIAVAGTL